MRRDRRLARFTVKLFLVMATGVPLCAGCAAKPRLLAGGDGLLKPLTIASIETAEGEQGTQITIQASRPFSYSLANHDKPPRVLVEIPGGHFAQRTSQIPVNKGVVRAIDLQERGDQAQVEVVLDRLVNYDIQKEENRLVLSFKGRTAAAGPQKEQDQPAMPVTEAHPPTAVGRGVTSREMAQTTKQLVGDTSSESSERLARLPREFVAGMGGMSPPNPLEQVIGGTDVLEITVYQEKDLSGVFRVSADGEIAFPLVGKVHVAGLTAPQAQEKLEGLLRAGYLKHPHIAVTVKEYHSKGVSVLGAVNKPGTFQLLGGRTTLLELLSMAEGVDLSEEGSKSLILVRPDERGETKSITIDLDRLLKGDASLNIIVQPNDTIYVQKAETVVVYGEVQKPGTYPLDGKEMTMLELLSKAGGLTKFAAPNRTRIIRMVDGQEKSIQLRLGDILKGERTREVSLQPGDIIVVPESYF